MAHHRRHLDRHARLLKFFGGDHVPHRRRGTGLPSFPSSRASSSAASSSHAALAQPRRKRSVVFVAAASLGGVLCAAFAAQYYRDEGTRRSVAFWRTAFPIYLHYRWVEWRTANESDEEISRRFNALHDKYAPIAEELVLRLRGFYLKNAQFASIQDSFLPPKYLEFCKRMQNEVPTEFQPGEAEEEVCKALHLDHISQVFSEFSSRPIGSASIGQVHLAVLKETGERVAVKVMGRGVEERFRADIQTIIDFCRLAMPQHVGPMREIQKQFVTEFNYLGEAQNLLDVRENILPIFGDRVHIPKPHMKLCAKNVLTMEYLQGPSLISGIRASYRKYAESQGTTLEKLEQEQLELMKRPDFKFRKIEDEAARTKFYTRVVQVKDAVLNAGVFAANLTQIPRLLYGRAIPKVETPSIVNLAEILRLLCEVHGHEIMVDGAFSCDPHPGNVLLMPDGRLGLIDMGQFKRIPEHARINFARCIVALANDDQAEVVRVLRMVGNRGKYNKSEVCYKLGVFWFDRNGPDVTEGRNLQQFIDYMESEDPAVSVNEDFVMPGRVSIMMRGMGNAFGLELSVAKLWEPIARKTLQAHGIEYTPVKSKANDYVFTDAR